MAASIKQIAEASNVSITTVSRVLRDRGDISPETRARVQAVARRMKYRPNLLVKGMQTGRTQTIGVLLSPADPFLAQVLSGVMDALAQADHVPIVLRAGASYEPNEPPAPPELEQIHRLVDRRVDGVILRPVEDAASDEYLKEVWNHNLPLIAIDRQLPHSHADFVGSDDRGGAAMAADHLLSLGHRRFGQICGASYTSTGRDRRDAFIETVSRCPNATCATREDPTFTHGYDQAMELLRLPNRPTAIFAGNDRIAENVYRAAKDLGLRIPEDLSVVGFSDLQFARWMQPALTTVRQEGRLIGRRAAELVLQRINGEVAKDQRQIIRLATQFVERDSTQHVRRGFRSG